MSRNKSLFIPSAFALITIILWSVNLFSSATAIYGPRKFIRATGKPVVVIETFSAPSATTYNLVVLNGENGKNRVSSATVKINGIEVLKESDFNQQVDRIERSVSLLLSNSISVELKSAPGSFITVSILGLNHPPVANAGQDQQVKVGDLVTLDGRNSYDPDGDLITYNWRITETPSGSSAALSNPTSVMPTFVPDKAGHYIILLTVNDGQVDSSPDDVVVIAARPNVAPTANAGPDQSVVTGSTVMLDGRWSFDPDGDPLTYRWQMLSLPSGSTAFLDSPTSPTPSFLADKDGQYVILLTVNDGELDSLPDDVVVISATPNAPPVAYAGDDQTVSRNKMISLDGTGSSDLDNDPLTYNWSIVSRPEGSTSELDDPTSPTPKILADREGEYVFRLVVYDGQLYSNPDTVVVKVVNDPPIANAGPDKDGVVGVLISLNGSGSSDPNGDTLTYQWTLNTAPSGSAAAINNPTSPTPTFTPDIPGSYTIQLVVNDGQLNSNPDTVIISAIIPNRNPIANPGGPYAGFIGIPVQFNGLGSSDPDGDPITYSWNFGDGTTGSGVSPTHTYASTGTYTVTLRVEDNRGGSGTAQTTAQINNPVPSLSSINPTSIIAGSPDFTLTVNGDNFITTSIVSFNNQQVSSQYISKTQLQATIPASAVTTQGSYPVKVGNPAPGGGVTDSLTFTVTPSYPNVEPQPEGSFGEQYQDLIPTDVTIQSYDPKRFSLITGLVRNSDGSPISDVSVNILGHQEYGTARTNAEGRFSIPVEGGETLTLTYRKEGLITTHRKAYVPWNDIPIGETIVMIPEDTKSTTLTFDGNPNTVLAHESTLFTDDRGGRSSTLVLTGDNRAYSVDASGNVIQELTTITARATEFTTENSMPAKLPPNSAYTYCVELSVDGAQRVRFDKPVILWIPNFLGFNVGEKVPVGYYDRDRGVWVPSDNGLVVRLLDTNGDGAVDALDANGDGQPDDLNGNGSFSDEVMGLSDPQRYPPNSSFWRVAVTHFSPWDCNWPYGPPADATAPNPKGISVVQQANLQGAYCRTPTSSFVEDRNQIFHEDIPIPGTDITLHYASSRVKDYFHVITVPVSGETVPASLKTIIVQVDVAGRFFEQILNSLPNQRAEFIWDGRDYLGRPINGPTTAHVSVGFVYDAVYYSAGNIAQAFAQAGREVTGILARQEVISWRRIDLVIYRATGGGVITEGWTLSSHHYLSPIDPSTLYKGDGTIVKKKPNIVTTIAGNGTSGYSGDGGPATQATLYYPYSVAIDASGNLYIIDYNNNRIRRIDTNGIITSVVGNGTYGYSGDGGPATQAALTGPTGLALDTLGNLYIADSGNYRIRKVDTNGTITTVAGGGYPLDGLGDGGLATQAALHLPYSVAVDTSGNLYITDIYLPRIRKVDTNGIITTVAGNGLRGFSGDGGLATQATFNYPEGIAIDSDGNLYIADAGNARIRKIDVSGIITTVAGRGYPHDYGGDEGQATEARLSGPSDVAVDATGNLYIVDSWNCRIRKVDPSGVITTIAGNGNYGYSGDGGPATEAGFWVPVGVAVDTVGNLYIADEYNHRVRKIDLRKALNLDMELGDTAFTEENGLGYLFSSAGRHKKTIDLDTGRTLYTFNYDENSNLISITDRFGNNTTIQRDTNGVPTAIISPDGITTTLAIDTNNYLTRISYPDGNFYTFEYTTGGLMTAKIEPEGNRFDHIFDSTGRLTDATDQEGGHWNLSRQVYENGDILAEILTAEGNLTSYLDHTESTGAYTSRITDPTGAQTVFTLSADVLTGSKSLPCGMNLSFTYEIDPQYEFQYVKEMREKTPSTLEKVILREKTYEDTNADNSIDRITDKLTLNGRLTAVVTDTLQSKRTLTSPLGRATTTFFDSNNLLTTRLTIPGLYDTNFGYDSRGRLTSINANIRQTTFAYDTQGNLSSITDPENRTTTYSYDVVGRTTGILRPDNSSVGFTYDKNGNMTVLTNPSAISHGFGYNNVNLNSSYQTPLSGSYSYLYNRDRQLTQISFPSGRQTINVYDKDRLIQTQTPEGNIDFSYLCGSKVGSTTKGTEGISYGYDGSLVTSEALRGTLNQTLSYTYNNDFNLSGLTYAGSPVNYTYDNDGLLTGAGAFTITRNAGNGFPESVTGGPLNLTRSFNGYGEVESQNFSVNSLSLTSWGLIRDKTGRIISKSETVEGITSNYVYTYDSMGRLLTVTIDGTLIEEYQYDSVGRRTYEMNVQKGISGRTFTYSNEDHLLTTGDVTYQYDADGFLTTKTQGTDLTTYNYSSRGELLSVTLPDGTAIEYVNDSLGRRIAKKVNGMITEKYLWQGLTRLLAVYDGSNNLIMRFEYADARMPVAMIKGGITYYLAYDQVGSLRIVADATDNMVKKIDYDSFGSIISDTNPGFQVPLGFAGGLHDRDTGLVKFGLRDYDPDTGRWTAKDPILFAGGDTDLYGYVANNPVNWVDPLGLRWYESPQVWLDMVALASDLLIPFFGPPAYVMGVAASFASTALTIDAYKHGKATRLDVVVSGGTTLLGIIPVLTLPADVVILLYDFQRAESDAPCKKK